MYAFVYTYIYVCVRTHRHTHIYLWPLQNQIKQNELESNLKLI